MNVETANLKSMDLSNKLNYHGLNGSSIIDTLTENQLTNYNSIKNLDKKDWINLFPQLKIGERGTLRSVLTLKSKYLNDKKKINISPNPSESSQSVDTSNKEKSGESSRTASPTLQSIGTSMKGEGYNFRNESSMKNVINNEMDITHRDLSMYGENQYDPKMNGIHMSNSIYERWQEIQGLKAARKYLNSLNLKVSNAAKSKFGKKYYYTCKTDNCVFKAKIDTFRYGIVLTDGKNEVEIVLISISGRHSHDDYPCDFDKKFPFTFIKNGAKVSNTERTVIHVPSLPNDFTNKDYVLHNSDSRLYNNITTATNNSHNFSHFPCNEKESFLIPYQPWINMPSLERAKEYMDRSKLMTINTKNYPNKLFYCCPQQSCGFRGKIECNQFNENDKSCSVWRNGQHNHDNTFNWDKLFDNAVIEDVQLLLGKNVPISTIRDHLETRHQLFNLTEEHIHSIIKFIHDQSTTTVMKTSDQEPDQHYNELTSEQQIEMGRSKMTNVLGEEEKLKRVISQIIDNNNRQPLYDEEHNSLSQNKENRNLMDLIQNIFKTDNSSEINNLPIQSSTIYPTTTTSTITNLAVPLIPTSNPLPFPNYSLNNHTSLTQKKDGKITPIHQLINTNNVKFENHNQIDLPSESLSLIENENRLELDNFLEYFKKNKNFPFRQILHNYSKILDMGQPNGNSSHPLPPKAENTQHPPTTGTRSGKRGSNIIYSDLKNFETVEQAKAFASSSYARVFNVTKSNGNKKIFFLCRATNCPYRLKIYTDSLRSVQTTNYNNVYVVAESGEHNHLLMNIDEMFSAPNNKICSTIWKWLEDGASVSDVRSNLTKEFNLPSIPTFQLAELIEKIELHTKSSLQQQQQIDFVTEKCEQELFQENRKEMWRKLFDGFGSKANKIIETFNPDNNKQLTFPMKSDSDLLFEQYFSNGNNKEIFDNFRQTKIMNLTTPQTILASHKEQESQEQLTDKNKFGSKDNEIESENTNSSNMEMIIPILQKLLQNRKNGKNQVNQPESVTIDDHNSSSTTNGSVAESVKDNEMENEENDSSNFKFWIELPTFAAAYELLVECRSGPVDETVECSIFNCLVDGCPRQCFIDSHIHADGHSSCLVYRKELHNHPLSDIDEDEIAIRKKQEHHQQNDQLEERMNKEIVDDHTNEQWAVDATDMMEEKHSIASSSSDIEKREQDDIRIDSKCIDRKRRIVLKYYESQKRAKSDEPK
ncbi:hypothetical protein SNEBB_006724 [Seison nebaliae]|nr:hypothetical protein SNEBB_006724 [Seison nebaliae]